MPTERKIEAMLTQQARRQLTERGISLHTIKQQLTAFHQGIPFATLKKPCLLNDGIHHIRASELPGLTQDFDQAMAAGRVTKFVPASGSATRMFKELLACHHQPGSASASDQHALEQVLANLQKFAFYHDLRKALARQGHDLDRFVSERNNHPILQALLYTPGLNYAGLPKGLLAFHRHAASTRTPIQEQLVEAAAYAKDAKGHTRLHLTCSAAHQEAVQQHIADAQRMLDHPTITWMVSCSIQNPSTDTLAVALDNQPVMDAHGHLLFRPAGHGALLPNLNELRGDILFIKNIDNVVPDHLKDETYTYKRALGGLLVGLQEMLFAYLRRLDSESVSSALLKEATEWAQDAFALTLPEKWEPLTHAGKTQWLFQALNRPIRVCGMVPNVAEPGGGPFWVDGADGTTSLQIVESAQVAPRSPAQQDIFKSSTHFNSVDLVCGVRDYTGQPFDLHQFVDPHTGFISRKFHEGREVKALELPGLWNGAMAHWHTVFVEVPRHTFNPVKTVLDLLLPAHQPPDH